LPVGSFKIKGFMNDNLIDRKAFNFAISIVKLYKKLFSEKEFTISKQLLRSGTSIGANIREGLQGQSKADFISKLSISLKEAVETEYWLELLVATDTTKIDLTVMLKDVKEIIRIITSIIKTSKSNC
jgi:four helix bundle protein